MAIILIKRVYEPAEETDGYRVLVDRLWPRGLRKEMLPAHVWIKGIAPSPLLRIWFNHDPAKWNVFRKSYMAELSKSDAVADLMNCCKEHPAITLLYAAKDKHYNHAVVLQQFLYGLLQNT